MFRNGYMISSIVHLDNDYNDGNYKNILIINHYPNGPLSNFVHKIHCKRLSHFESDNDYEKCVFAIFSFKHPGKFMTMDEIPDLYSFLLSNDYMIDSKFNDLLNQSDIKYNNKKILFFVFYK